MSDDVRQDAPPAEVPPEVPTVPPVVPPVPTPDPLAALQASLDELKAANAVQAAEIAKLKAPAPTPKVDDDDNFDVGTSFEEKYNIPAEAVRDIIKVATPVLERRALRKAQDWIQGRDAAEQLRSKFYKDNPDLGDHKEIVAAISQDIYRTSPELTVEQAMNEAAKRSRSQIKAIQDKAAANRPPEPPLAIPPNGSRAPIVPANGKDDDRPLTAEEEIQRDLAERRAQKETATRLK